MQTSKLALLSLVCYTIGYLACYLFEINMVLLTVLQTPKCCSIAECVLHKLQLDRNCRAYATVRAAQRQH